MKTYRFFFQTPDGARQYHLDTHCNFGDVTRSKHYVIDNPENQLETISRSFYFAWTEFTKYRNSPVWKNAWYGEMTVGYEEVPDDELRPLDKIFLKLFDSGKKPKYPR